MDNSLPLFKQQPVSSHTQLTRAVIGHTQLTCAVIDHHTQHTLAVIGLTQVTTCAVIDPHTQVTTCAVIGYTTHRSCHWSHFTVHSLHPEMAVD